MDPGTNDYRSGNVNADLRNSSYRVSTGIPILDDSMQGGGYAESVGQEKAGSFLCLNRAQVEYLHSHPYTQSSTAENDRHYLSSFNELPHSGSRKHSLSGVVRTRRRKAG
ncbi:unnamed protein product [Heterobilharzia americana]|nr:unnamed protein product [Heterobilharzia americana]